MADISNVRYEEIKDITESLESLSCKCIGILLGHSPLTLVLACIITRVLY